MPHNVVSVKHKGLITGTVMLASILQSLDTTIANIALPRMQGSLSATQDQMTWVLTSYIVAAAIMTPLSGWLAGQFGRKRLFVVSIVGFTVASTLCGLSQTLPEAVVARLLQGVFGAALMPMSQAVLLDINPPEMHGRAMAVWAQGAVAGPIFGPVLGGWLTEQYNWRWVFYINIPLGILALLGILAFLPESPGRRSRFDFFGFATLSLAIGGMQMMLDRGEFKDWFNSTEIWVESVLATLALYLFVVHSATNKHPFIRAALFKDRNYISGSCFIFLMGLVLFSTMALMPPLLQDLLNYPVLEAGLITAPRGIGSLVSMMIVGRLVHRVDPRIFLGLGFLLNAFSLWMMTWFSPQMGESLIIWSGTIQGIGTGMSFVPMSAIAFATLTPDLRNEGTALFNLLRNIGASVGISGTQALLTSNTQVVHSALATQLTPFNLAAHHPQTALALAAKNGMAVFNQFLTGQAELISYIDDFYVMAIVTVLSMPLLLLVRKPRGARSAVQAVVE